MKRVKIAITCLSVILACSSCQKNLEQSIMNNESPQRLMTKAVVPEVFDWETVDWMPTPAGQSLISVPWTGSGSIVGSYPLDVVNDYKKSDGWKLLYSTFTSESGAPLVNPYFVLYNVYRGVLRIYLYVTTEFVHTSSYLNDYLSIDASQGVSSNMLSFLQGSIVDPDTDIMNFSQIQPKANNGAAPLASNKWYMMEYEIAYDSNMENLNWNQIRLLWQLDFKDVSKIKIDEVSNSTVKSVISSTATNPFDLTSEEEQNILEGLFSIGGLQFLSGFVNPADSTRNNTLGLSNSLFSTILNGVSSVVSSISGGVPAFFTSLLCNGTFGGATSSSSPVVNLKVSSDIKLTGSNTNSGSLPSMPISWYIPGSIIPSNIQGYIPLENETLGVIGWNGDNSVTINIQTDVYELEDDIMFTGIYEVRESVATLGRTDFSSCIEVNPSVLEVADVSIVSHDVVAYDTDAADAAADAEIMYGFPLYETRYTSPWEYSHRFPEYTDVVARFIVKVQPKNGAPASYIYKLFDLDFTKHTTITNHF